MFCLEGRKGEMGLGLAVRGQDFRWSNTSRSPASDLAHFQRPPPPPVVPMTPLLLLRLSFFCQREKRKGRERKKIRERGSLGVVPLIS